MRQAINVRARETSGAFGDWFTHPTTCTCRDCLAFAAAFATAVRAVTKATEGGPAAAEVGRWRRDKREQVGLDGTLKWAGG